MINKNLVQKVWQFSGLGMNINEVCFKLKLKRHEVEEINSKQFRDKNNFIDWLNEFRKSELFLEKKKINDAQKEYRIKLLSLMA